MAVESELKQSGLLMLPTVAASRVPTPGDGPVLFANSTTGDAGAAAISAKLPNGATIVLGASYMSDAKQYGAKGDTIQTTCTVAALGTTTTIAGLTQADVGKVISIEGAGATADLITTIAAVDGTTVTLTNAATDGATGAVTFIGTSDGAALDLADAAATAAGTMLVPPGMYLVGANVTISAGTVKVMRGASFVVLEGFTLAFTGFIEAAPNQIAVLLDADANGALTRDVPNVMAGSGSPENAVVGIIGDQFQRTNGSTDTTLYVKEAGDNTDSGWVGFGAP